MTEFYCKCLNACLVTDDSQSYVPFLGIDNLAEYDRNHEFFRQLPLVVTHVTEVKKVQPLLIEFEKVGSWTLYKCINCLTYLYANSKINCSMVMNNSLSQISEEEFQNIESSPDFSLVYRILITDYSSSHFFDVKSSPVLEECCNNKVLEMKRQLMDNIERKKKNTEKIVQKFVDEQQNLLKEFIVRANNDFQILKKLLSSRDEPTIYPYQEQTNESVAYPTKETSSVLGCSEKNTVVSQISEMEKNWDKDISATDIPPSFDSEGLFPLDGMEENTILEDDDHSDDDLSDTDDSGSRDEGIHIPRRQSITFAKSLPIRVPSDFDPSLRLFDARLEENKSKPSYKQKRNERPLDIAASIQALANSVHGDAVFGDLPRRKAGFRI